MICPGWDHARAGSRSVCAMLLVVAIAGCGGQTVPQDAVTHVLQTRLGTPGPASFTVRGELLYSPSTTKEFYLARGFRPAWSSSGRAAAIVKAIDDIRLDGLTPGDYHRDPIAKLLAARSDSAGPALEADLDVLLTDALARMLDHVSYGRVRPVSLDPRWNVNPRDGAPPPGEALAKIAAATDVAAAFEAAKPRHFIYRGLVEALAQLREIEAGGGWPVVRTGGALRPGAADPRVPSVRARLRASGEYTANAGADSLLYDPALAKAVALFQRRHRLIDDRIVDAGTVAAMNVSVADRIGQVRVNLERARWVISGLADDFLLVNLPAFKAYLIRGGRNVWETRTQIGKEARQTPTFRSDMKTVVFNPDWTVPPTILAEDVLEGMRRGDNPLARKHLVVLDDKGREVDPATIDWKSATPEHFPYTLRQPPGEDNALGRVKFLFPNPHSIYLHDTPSRDLFDAESRTLSSGCIRVEHPLDLAERLLSWPRSKIDEALAGGETRNVAIDPPLPVLIVYWTVSVGVSGEVRYMRDVYDLDGPVLAALDRR